MPQQQQKQQQKQKKKRGKSKMMADHLAIGKLFGEIGVAIAGQSQRTVATAFNMVIAIRGLSGHVVPAYMVATQQQQQQQQQKQQVTTARTDKPAARKRRERPVTAPPPPRAKSSAERELNTNITSIVKAIQAAKKNEGLSAKELLAASHPLSMKLKEAHAALAEIKQAGLSPTTKASVQPCVAVVVEQQQQQQTQEDGGLKEENAARKRKNESKQSSNKSTKRHKSALSAEPDSAAADPPRPSRLSRKEVIYYPAKPPHRTLQ